MAAVSLPSLFLLLASVSLLGLHGRGVEGLTVPVSVQDGNDSECMSAQELQEDNLTDYPGIYVEREGERGREGEREGGGDRERERERQKPG